MLSLQSSVWKMLLGVGEISNLYNSFLNYDKYKINLIENHSCGISKTKLILIFINRYCTKLKSIMHRDF